jgi:uncharacterized protein (DUF1778 family)
MKTETKKRGPGRPATGQMPKRYFRMDDESWGIIEHAAATNGQNVSDFIRDTLLRAAKRRRESA